MAKAAWQKQAAKAMAAGEKAPPLLDEADAGCALHMPRLVVNDGTVGREVCLSSETSCRVFGSFSDRTHCRAELVIGRHGAVLLTVLRLRVSLRHRIISRTGRPHKLGNSLEFHECFTPSRDRRGALEEGRRPFRDPICVKRPVSEGRTALPTPFETKRKKTPIGTLGRI